MNPFLLFIGLSDVYQPLVRFLLRFKFWQLHPRMGRKDAVLVMKSTDYTGLYLYHCHILEHEDMGMMRNDLVKD
jgi:FtsP/CotA-like multicopper oxidase with cupredoxin domain